MILIVVFLFGFYRKDPKTLKDERRGKN